MWKSLVRSRGSVIRRSCASLVDLDSMTNCRREAGPAQASVGPILLIQVQTIQ